MYNFHQLGDFALFSTSIGPVHNNHLCPTSIMLSRLSKTLTYGENEMINLIQKFANRIAMPFNLIALIGVLISGWFTYQNSGFNFTVWLPIALVGISLTLSYWAKRA